MIRVARTDHQPTPPPLERTAFVVLWATGSDTALDGVFKVEALKRHAPDEPWQTFEALCKPEADSDPVASARMAAEYGVDARELGAAEPVQGVFERLAGFLEGCTVLTADAEGFEAWWSHHLAPATPPASLGLCDLAALFLPGRLALRREELVADLAGGERRAMRASQVQAAFVELATRVHQLPREVLHLCVHGLVQAWRGYAACDEGAAARLRLSIAVLDRVDRWSGGGGLDFAALPSGVLSALAREDVELAELVAACAPRCSADVPRWRELASLPPRHEPDEERPMLEEDLARLDEVFEVHLPRAFAVDGAPAKVRRAQHELARQVGLSLGRRELLMVHAPTGTGKTLAYLVPALLWAARNEVRVGLATYTRALQEQAWDKEVPRAVRALRAAGVEPMPRVAVLKGRENYLCWRALRHATPEDDSPDAWLAWTRLAMFALVDPDADLDRLPGRAPLVLEDSSSFAKAHEAALQACRARPACCLHKADKDACGAEVARLKAERCHVVVVNQALALSRQEFFRVLVFDECEHLHDQAHAVWSRTLPLEDIPALLQRLRQPRRTQSRAVINRLEDALGFDEEALEHLEAAKLSWQDLRAAYASLALAVQAFDAWRQGESRARPERELHSLLREWIVDHAEDSADLLEARVEWEQAANEMDAALAALAELSSRGPGVPGSTRRNLDLARTELAEQVETMRAWIPMAEGKPRFLARTFHDVEIEQRGANRRVVLASRVLLPHEFLGDLYYPDLHGAIFVSATTWLRGSFESSLAYLGVGRPMAVAGHALRTWRAEEAFDYGRVLVCLPSDAPSPAQAGKQRFLEYVRTFVAHLAERTRGRALVLFTSHDDLRRVALELEGFFRARRLPLLWQGMPGASKEELAELFRARVDATLLGVDTFWHGADFPGETLEHLVIAKLPFGVPDRYHHAQCAALGQQEQERAIYKPRALATLRQGFGRLMRRETDRGVVWLLDHRVYEPRHREFLRELPLADLHPDQCGARLARATTEQCLQKSFAFMSLLADIRRRSLDTPFLGPTERRLELPARDEPRAEPAPRRPRRVEEEPPDISSEELPF